MKITTSQYEILVPRYGGAVKSHVLVKLTLVHDREDVDTKREPLLEMAVEILSTWDVLPDKCSITLSLSDIILKIIERNIEMVEKWRHELNLPTLGPA